MRAEKEAEDLVIAVCPSCRQALGYALDFAENPDSEAKRRSCEFCNRRIIDKLYKATDLNKRRQHCRERTRK